MNLYLILKTLWRHKIIMFFSAIAGAWLALSATQNSHTTYQGKLDLMLDAGGGGLVTVGRQSNESGFFARTVQLANTYAYMLTSTPVTRKLHKKFGPISEEISALANDGAPIITLTIIGDKPTRIQMLSKGMAESFSTYISEVQNINNIANEDRIKIVTLGEPTLTQLKSRKQEIALLMLLGPLMFGVAASLMLENLKASREREKEQKVLTAVVNKPHQVTEDQQKETVNEVKA